MKILIVVFFGITFSQDVSPSYINKYNGIDKAEAEILLAKAQRKSNFPIVVNAQVIHYLNLFLGNPAGRLRMKATLKRMHQHKEIIVEKLEKHDVPEELMAIPIIESEYRNIHSNGTGSGLWMLIQTTARAKGLRVDDSKDERLNVERATDVALGYLKSNHRTLKDWQLAILAYNLGESKVRWAMLETRSKDPWVLISKGHERDKGYLAKIMAAIIIMKNPDILK